MYQLMPIAAFSLLLALYPLLPLARRLDFEHIALGYEPDSSVTDHASIDLDQASMEAALAMQNEESFENAKAIYLQGGHSKSYAAVTLGSPLAAYIRKGTVITGYSSSGNPVYGIAYADYSVGDTEIKIQYQTIDVQANYVSCQVGALTMVGEEGLEGCLGNEGEINIKEVGSHSYSYIQEIDNRNGRTLAGFSTEAKGKMYRGCPGCPYPDYLKFYNYYGVFDYGHEWVMAALDGKNVSFANGFNANFGEYSLIGRREAVRKGTAYMNVWMYVLRKLYNALDGCRHECINCNEDPVREWDEGVAFFVGSKKNFMPFRLGNKRCGSYVTCGPDGGELQGTAKVNYDIMKEFSSGQYNLKFGYCNQARENAARIAELMTIPIIQGALQYAYKVEFLQGTEKEKAEVATFAAAVLPVLHACDASAAQTVYENTRVGTNYTNFMEVRDAFEAHYECMGITCEDIGGLFNSGSGEYYNGFQPCSTNSVDESAATTGVTKNIIALGVKGLSIVFFAVLAAI